MSIIENGTRVAATESSYTDGRAVGYNTAALRITAEYTNFSKTTLYLKTQSNVPFAVEPNEFAVSTDERREHLEVKLTYALQTNACIDNTFEVLSMLVANEHILSEEASKLKDHLIAAYNKDASRTNKSNINFVVFRRVLMDDIERSANTYFRECDVIITRDRTELPKPHPNSSIGLQELEVRQRREYVGQAGIFVKVIDNECLAEERFYYSGKHLITVPSLKDPERESGVYYTLSTSLPKQGLTPETKMISFKEAEELIGLYRFREDALTHGNPERQAKMREKEVEGELMTLRRDLEARKTENASLKEEAERRKALRDDVVDDAKTQRALKKLEEEHRQLLQTIETENERKHRDNYYDLIEKRRKDHYEERSYVRKDTSEWIKFIPAVLLGIGATFAFMSSRN